MCFCLVLVGSLENCWKVCVFLCYERWMKLKFVCLSFAFVCMLLKWRCFVCLRFQELDCGRYLCILCVFKGFFFFCCICDFFVCGGIEVYFSKNDNVFDFYIPMWLFWEIGQKKKKMFWWIMDQSIFFRHWLTWLRNCAGR